MPTTTPMSPLMSQKVDTSMRRPPPVVLAQAVCLAILRRIGHRLESSPEV